MTITYFHPDEKARYILELIPLKNIPVYITEEKVDTPEGRLPPSPGLLIHIDPHIKGDLTPPETFGEYAIDENIVKYMALYHKYTVLSRSKLIVTETAKSKEKIETMQKILENLGVTFSAGTHKGRKALHITDKKFIEATIQHLGNSYAKKYPPWLLGLPLSLQRVFIKERIRNASVVKKNTIEIVTSSTNNEVLLELFTRNKLYVSARRIPHKMVKKRQLWIMSLYPMTSDAKKLIKSVTGAQIGIRTKNIINLEPYYVIRSVELPKA